MKTLISIVVGVVMSLMAMVSFAQAPVTQCEGAAAAGCLIAISKQGDEQKVVCSAPMSIITGFTAQKLPDENELELIISGKKVTIDNVNSVIDNEIKATRPGGDFKLYMVLKAKKDKASGEIVFIPSGFTSNKARDTYTKNNAIFSCTLLF